MRKDCFFSMLNLQPKTWKSIKIFFEGVAVTVRLFMKLRETNVFSICALAQLSYDNDVFISIRRIAKIIYSKFKF